MATIDCGFSDTSALLGQDALISHGPTLPVQIGFDADYEPGAKRLPILPSKQFSALVDTGATISCIDSSLAVSLNLPIVDRRDLGGIHGSIEVNMHLAQIYIPSLAFTIYGSFAGVHLIAGGQRHHALIGRTFLCRFTMKYKEIITLSETSLPFLRINT